MADMLSSRQISFHRTIESYILMDKLDMIGTHFLIYDVSDLYRPKVISGIRVVYNERCQKYGLKLPLDENILSASLPVQEFYRIFKKDKPDLAECTGWYVDSEFSFAKSKLDLAEILFFAITTYLLRQEIPYFSGATNERYKASRWVAKVGEFKDGYTFMHPTIPYDHKLTLVEHFYNDWLRDCFSRYGKLMDNRYEIAPKETEKVSLDQVKERIFRMPETGTKKAS
jgi:hypothetical protein